MSAAVDAMKSGDLRLALDELKKEIRQSPADSEKRVFLFQLLSVFGEWEKALTQLDVARETDPKNLPMGQTYEQVLQCERLRQAVFDGKQVATVLGEPPEWVALLQQSVKHAAEGSWSEFAELQSAAFSQAETVSGKIYLAARGEDGEPSAGQVFQWIADGDMRMGPLVEAIVNGRYYWIPFEYIATIELDSPTDLRDLVWTPANFRWKNKGEAVGFIPTRYPGTQFAKDDRLRLARMTEWSSPLEEVFLGSGMRVFTTDESDYSISEIRRIVIGDEQSESE